ncbi:MAG: glycoside hydrolase family 3 C-terminal domain-containing protein [Chitinophagaceae bacterium]|nr:glycoside hydrolase family 3 C-terminal domain-containing protein [Chitinophagaceae bacterium]
MNFTKHIFLIAISFLGSISSFAQTKKVDVNIVALIKKMSIEEKAGQMTQIDLGVIAEGGICALKNPQTIDLKKIQEAISKYHIGSILNVGCGSGTISLENWHKILNTIHLENARLSKNNIPILYGIDAIHGANYTIGATLFPQQIAQAATWNPALVKKGYEITAYEVRATGIPWNFSPVLDLGRQPLWSRFFETFGEDVYLAKTMTKVAIEGYQGNDVSNPYKVASCMKHFLGYSMPLSGKDRTPAWISDRELREYFLPTFQTAISAGAKTVMINSGDINGTPVHANKDILTKLLRNELGFKGVAVTDWEDIYKLVNVHRIAKTKKEAVKMAIMAGIDMSMTPNDFEFTTLLVELVKEGSIPESRLDLSVKRILQLKKELALFSHTEFEQSKYPLFGSEEHAKASYDVAKESMTLLKNKNNILPLKSNDKIFVCGPAANSLNLLNGAWTHTWQGVDPSYNTKNKFTILDALQNQNGLNVSYELGVSIDSIQNIEACLREGKKADKIIICVGETPSTEIVGNINDLTLSFPQIELINQLATLEKPIILVCNFNRPRILNLIESKVDAILYSYLPGDEGGKAIKDVLIGIENPSGKLPFTYPRFVNSFVHYDHKATEELDVDFSMNAYKPQFDFGFGMSYTTFEYSNCIVSDTNLYGKQKITVSVTVKNSGKVKGKEVVQLYYNDLVASITPSVKKLTKFSKIELKPNETRKIEFEIKKSDFSFINKDLKRVTEPGEIELIINNLKKIIYVQ